VFPVSCGLNSYILHEFSVFDSNKNLVLGLRWGLTPRLTGLLTVGRDVTLISEFEGLNWHKFWPCRLNE
jgi:hypothetical protein